MSGLSRFAAACAVRCRLNDEMAALLHKALGLLLDANGHEKALDAEGAPL